MIKKRKEMSTCTNAAALKMKIDYLPKNFIFIFIT